MRNALVLLVVGVLSWSSAPFAHAADGAEAAAATTPPPMPPPAPTAYSVVNASNPDPCCLRCPRWHVAIGAWVFGMEGTAEAQGRTVAVDSEWTDVADILENIEFSINARVRLETHRWRFTVTVDGVTLGDSATFREGALTVDGEVSQWIVAATVGYVIAGGKTDCSACAGTWCLDAFAGVRFWSIGLDVAGTIGAFAPIDRDETWVDPIVGLHFDVTWRKWAIALEGDVGGFGVGSEFAWNAMGSVAYRFNCNFSILAGWRVLDVDREDGDFVYDMTMSGPFIALGFSF
jgi:hypothetical protein